MVALSGISSRGELLDLIERTGAAFALKGNRLRVLHYCFRLIRDPRVGRRAVEELERAGFLIRTCERFHASAGILKTLEMVLPKMTSGST